MGNWAADLLYSFRVLRKTPWTTAFVVLSLASAIAANTSAFAVWNALVLRPITAFEPDRLVAIRTTASEPSGEDRLPIAAFEQLNGQYRSISGLFVWRGDYPLRPMEVDGNAFPGLYADVSERYFQTLGVAPLLGRLITAEDAGRDVAVLDYRCWANRLNGDPGVIGKTIRVGRRALTIIGVTPEKFTGMEIEVAPDVTAPLERGPAFAVIVGRLAPGATIQAAESEIRSVWARIAPSEFRGRGIRIDPLEHGVSFLRERQTGPLLVLMTLIGVLLSIACANVANIMLARSAARRHELQVRIALGATRWRIVRLLFMEGLLVAAGGSAVGALFAFWAGPRLFQLAWTGYTPSVVDARPDARVLVYTVALGFATALLIGLAPTRATVPLAGRGVRGRTTRSERALVIVQVGLSVVLVTGSMLLVRTLTQLRKADLGFRRDGILILRLFPRNPGTTFADRTTYYRELATRLAALPGVEEVSFSGMGPIALGENSVPVAIAGGEPETRCVLDQVGPAFFRTMEMRVLAGREFDWRDVGGTPDVAVISGRLASRLFRGQDPLGRQIDLGGPNRRDRALVIGVVNDARLWRARDSAPLAAYVPIMQQPAYNQFSVDIRTSGDPRALFGAARRTLESMGRHLPLRIETLRQHEDVVWAEERMLSTVSEFLGVLAVLLASVGVYAVTSHSVARRTSEIGVRMALGATRSNVLGLIMTETATLAAAGLIVGIPGTLAGSQLLSGLVYGVSPRDPASVSAASALIVLVALASAWLPALRAASVDPTVALRAD